MREAYLLHTWHESTRPQSLDFGASAPMNWLGLKIIRAEAGGPTDQRGVVEFVARYKIGGKAQRVVEISQFIRENGRWFYLDGTLPKWRDKPGS
jgi:SEC-C motif-containing protein